MSQRELHRNTRNEILREEPPFAAAVIGLVCCVVLLAATAIAQPQTIETSYPGEAVDVTISVLWGRVQLEPSEQDDVLFTAIDDFGQPAAVRVAEERNRVRIEQEPPPQGQFRSANLIVAVPDRANVTVRVERGGEVTSRDVTALLEITNLNGSVDVRGHRGAAAINASNGSIRADLVQVDPEQPLVFASLNGSVEVCLGGDVDRDVLLSSRDDRVSTDFAIERATTRELIPAGSVLEAVDDSIRGTIGVGGAMLRASTLNGELALRRCQSKDLES